MIITAVVTGILGAAGIVFLGMAPKDAFIAGGTIAQVLGLLAAPCSTTEEGDSSSYGGVLLLAACTVVAGTVLWLNMPYQFLLWSAVVLLLNGWKGMEALGATTKFGKAPGSRTVLVRDAGVIRGASELLAIFYLVALVMATVWYFTS